MLIPQGQKAFKYHSVNISYKNYCGENLDKSDTRLS